jgi:hypothetical protein
MEANIIGLQKCWVDEDDKASARSLLELADSTGYSTFEELMESSLFNAERSYVIEKAKEFQQFGFATYTKGSRGHPSRVEWLYPPRVIGKAILGDSAELDELIRSTGGSTLAGEAGYRGKKNWRLSEVLEVLSLKAGIPGYDLVIDLRIPEAKRMLALSQGIPEDNVDVRIGW